MQVRIQLNEILTHIRSQAETTASLAATISGNLKDNCVCNFSKRNSVTESKLYGGVRNNDQENKGFFGCDCCTVPSNGSGPGTKNDGDGCCDSSNSSATFCLKYPADKPAVLLATQGSADSYPPGWCSAATSSAQADNGHCPAVVVGSAPVTTALHIAGGCQITAGANTAMLSAGNVRWLGNENGTATSSATAAGSTPGTASTTATTRGLAMPTQDQSRWQGGRTINAPRTVTLLGNERCRGHEARQTGSKEAQQRSDANAAVETAEGEQGCLAISGRETKIHREWMAKEEEKDEHMEKNSQHGSSIPLVVTIAAATPDLLMSTGSSYSSPGCVVIASEASLPAAVATLPSLQSRSAGEAKKHNLTGKCEMLKSSRAAGAQRGPSPGRQRGSTPPPASTQRAGQRSRSHRSASFAFGTADVQQQD